MTQPLAGVRVIDFTTLLPGPLATLMLARAGADVTKIERPGGEEMRTYEPRVGGTAAYYQVLNQGKAIVELDLKSPEGRSAALDLAADADVVVEQFRPGVMSRLGLGVEDLHAVNPRLIICSITGYGQTGPKSDRVGHDLNYVGDTGLLALSPGTLDAPSLPPALIADIGGGSFPAVTNILLALIGRERSGKGCHLDIAMTDAMTVFAWWAVTLHNAGEDVPKVGEGIFTGGSPRYQLYRTKDDKLLAVAALEQKFWMMFADAIALSAEARDDARDPATSISEAASIIRSRPAAHWAEIFDRVDCCVTLVQSLPEALRHPHFSERNGARSGPQGGAYAFSPLPLPIDPGFQGG